MTNDRFWTWVDQEKDRRHLSYAEIERVGGVANATVSKPARNYTSPTITVCLAIAKAFDVPPEDVLRLAGLLPSLPPAVAEEREALTILRGLPSTARSVVMTMLRALGRTVGSAPPPPLTTDQDDVLNRELLSEFERVPDEWKQEVINQARMLRRLAEHPPARFIGEDAEQRETAEIGSL